jgi:hypothetical protein
VKRAAAPLAILAAGTLLCLLLEYWPHVRNEFFVIAGSRNETGGWYGFHSGLGGAAYISVFPALTLWYWHNTCHEKPSCLRYGKYEVAGGLGRKCRRHHPDLKDHPRERHGAVLDRLHDEWKRRQQ